MHRGVACVLGIALAGSLRADDGWWSTTGSIGAFGKSHPTISMVSEDLRITLRDGTSARVAVDFVFKNSGRATQVTMAFPERYELRQGASMEHFRSFLDGNPVRTRRKIIERGEPRNEGDTQDSAVWLKRVSFATGQTRHVRVLYDGWYSGNTSGDVELEYVLTTGSTWKGPIGSCRITVDFTGLRKLSAPYPDLPGANWSYPRRGIMTTVLANWKPSSDLSLRMIPGYWNMLLNGSPVNCQEARRKSFPPFTVGKRSDPMVSADCFSFLFGAKEHDKDSFTEWKEWKNPISAKFGGEFTIDHNRLTLASGRVVGLPRKSKTIRQALNGDPRDYHEYVYLKDVVRALGGEFDYVESLDQIRLQF